MQRLRSVPFKVKLFLGTFAIGSAAASSQWRVMCQGHNRHEESSNKAKDLFSTTASSGLSAVSYVKEKVQNTGVVRFGRAALVVRIAFFTGL